MRLRKRQFRLAYFRELVLGLADEARLSQVPALAKANTSLIGAQVAANPASAKAALRLTISCACAIARLFSEAKVSVPAPDADTAVT